MKSSRADMKAEACMHTSHPEMAWLVSAAKKRESTLVGSSWDLINWHTSYKTKTINISCHISTIQIIEIWLFSITEYTFSYLVIRNSCSKLGQTNNRVVCRVQIGELLAQEVLQPGHIGQGEVVRRCERLSSSESKAEENQPEQPCRHTERTDVNLSAGRKVYAPVYHRGEETTHSYHVLSLVSSFIEINVHCRLKLRG